MRIIATDKDYYDCIQAHGQDRSLIYFRKPEEVHFKWGKWPFPAMDAWWFWDYNITQYMIGFCGKIYPILELYLRSERDNGRKCFGIDEVDAFVERSLKSGQTRAYHGQTFSGLRRGGKQRKQFAQFFETCKKQQNSYTDYFLEKRCPIFVAKYSNYKEGIITYNALLRQYDFIRVFDPYSAFQEISMFMGGMAMPEKVMPVISDKLKIHSRGFTDQSFRSPFRDSRRIPK